MLLSILIPTLPERSGELSNLIKEIRFQVLKSGIDPDLIEIITNDLPRSVTTGEKRNLLIAEATGKYIWFLDDDDDICPGAMNALIPALQTGADVIGVNGYITTDGANRVDWEIRLGHPYKAIQKDGKEYYLRHPNHITPMLRSIACQIKFPHKHHREDYEWAVALKESGLLKTETIIHLPIYHYKFKTVK